MVKVNELKIKGYSYSGFVYVHELPSATRAKIPTDIAVLEVCGDFQVSFPDATVEVEVSDMVGYLDFFNIPLEDSDINYKAFAHDILMKGNASEWLQDKIDNAYDRGDDS